MRKRACKIQKKETQVGHQPPSQKLTGNLGPAPSQSLMGVREILARSCKCEFTRMGGGDHFFYGTFGFPLTEADLHQIPPLRLPPLPQQPIKSNGAEVKIVT